MTNLQDFRVLEELFDLVEQFRQRKGQGPRRSRASSSHRLARELARYADDCRTGKLSGRARKRKSGELFRRIVSLVRNWS